MGNDGAAFERMAVTEAFGECVSPRMEDRRSFSVAECPVCGGVWNHHTGVVTFDRGEDQPTTVRLNGEVASLDGPNPSSRRDAVRILFWCEEDHYWWLDVVQHKGQTWLSCCIPPADYRALLRRMPYQDYLKTEHWQQTRRTSLALAGGRCQLCNSPHQLDVHHRTYERRGEEEPGDLTVLCRSCHARFHKENARG
jgi:Zn-finger nucleic acid-binding protein